MGLPPWHDPSSAELLALGVDAIAAGDARGLTLLRRVLSAECGPAFATTIAEALADGTPTLAFDFLPPPTPRSGAGRSTPAAPAATQKAAVAEAFVPAHAAVGAPGARAAPSPGASARNGTEGRAASPGHAPAGAPSSAAPEAAAPGPSLPAGGAAGPVPPPRRAPARGPSPPAPPLPETGYVTVADVAAHFGVSVKAVYRWMSAGRIRSERRPGGSYRIPAEQFHSAPAPDRA